MNGQFAVFNSVFSILCLLCLLRTSHESNAGLCHHGGVMTQTAVFQSIKAGFGKIIKIINELVVQLNAEQKEDDQKKDYCDAEFDKTGQSQGVVQCYPFLSLVSGVEGEPDSD